MEISHGVIMVINHAQRDANNLKQLIEFMDEPDVRTASPQTWRKAIGEKRLGAIFVGADLSESEVDSVLDDVGAMDPNVPIVILNNSATT